MNASRRWLEDFLRRPLAVRELVNRLARLGAPVDAVVQLHAELEGIVVALVEEVRPHPNADRLRVCLVNDGTAERRHVVCGAPNVVAGGKYPFAPIGATLPGGLVIEKRKLRGETSEGMLCSSRELGLGADADGLMTLETGAAPGTPLLDVLPQGDDRLVLDGPPPRPGPICSATRAWRASSPPPTRSRSASRRFPEAPSTFRPSVLPSLRPALRAGWRSPSRRERPARGSRGRSFAGSRWGPRPTGSAAAWRRWEFGASATWWTPPTTSCSSWASRSMPTTWPGWRGRRSSCAPPARASGSPRSTAWTAPSRRAPRWWRTPNRSPASAG